MSISARVVVLAVVCNLWACTTPTHEPPAPAVTFEPVDTAPEVAAAAAADDGVSVLVARTLITPTPAMLKAALSNDPDAMRDAAAIPASCHASSSCPAQFGSCSGWSTTTLCGATCGPGVCICKPVIQCEGEPPVDRGTNSFNAFRVCFDANQNACTEWTLTTSTFCGC